MTTCCDFYITSVFRHPSKPACNFVGPDLHPNMFSCRKRAYSGSCSWVKVIDSICQYSTKQNVLKSIQNAMPELADSQSLQRVQVLLKLSAD